MPFNYQVLKNLTGSQALVDSTVTGSDLAANAVTNSKIANGTITSTQMGVGSVNLSSATVSGTLPFTRGGTGQTGFGSAYHVLTTNSANNATEFKPSGIYRMVVFTGNGTWSKGDSRVRYIQIQVQGAGGGAAGHGESGAAGGYSERMLDVTSINNVGITIGGGGGGRGVMYMPH